MFTRLVDDGELGRDAVDRVDISVLIAAVAVVVQAVGAVAAQIGDLPLEDNVLLKGGSVRNGLPAELGLPVGVRAVHSPVAAHKLLNVKERAAALEVVARVAAPEGGRGNIANIVLRLDI